MLNFDFFNFLPQFPVFTVLKHMTTFRTAYYSNNTIRDMWDVTNINISLRIFRLRYAFIFATAFRTFLV